MGTMGERLSLTFHQPLPLLNALFLNNSIKIKIGTNT